ncbi:pyrin [Saimiri boliviensis]|uniref:Pyrin n=1 Tax=Saimiri boliviensis boliviensis TaxID=39432 RepID=A0A2K6T323_SAIBB|nr:pyrin [Saimiri boliviensis boliviensis]XP_010337411.1 pyrin [Saimiri boliviensis boliviensis]XP_010337412.1 pyrin [Saimiri boliviensis boliviensis]
MAKRPSDHLLSILEELVPYDFEKFKFKLQNTSVEKEHSRIPRGQIQTARRVKMASLLVTYYGEEYAVRLTLQVLRAMNQHLLAEELHRVAVQEYSTQESGTDGSAAFSSLGTEDSRGLKPEPGSLKTLDDLPEGKERSCSRQCGDGAANPLCPQPEAGRGLLRKALSKHRESASEGLDTLGKPRTRTRSPALTSGRSPSRAREGVQAEVRQLRRNASSAGRLQKECRAFEVCQPSGKKRPKSLEFTVSTGEKAPANPEILLTLEETRAVNLDLAAASQAGSTPDGGASADLGEGSGNPERSVTGRPPDKASSPHCHALEGGPVGGTCLHDSCSCPKAASGHPEASGSCSPGCPRCQASHERKNTGSLSPQPLPQCKRHLKQVQLLFCKDHGEPICLICSMSQEHRGHRMCPIEEAALEQKEQIQEQLKYLKKLRKSGEEERSYGNEKAVSFLKETEMLKQRVQRKLEQLYHFLEQQEHLFLASLEDLGQMVGQFRKSYDTCVSRDITLLDTLIGELEAKQCQSEWELLQDIRDILHRAKKVPVPQRWTTPQEIKEKIHLLHQKSEFVEKSAKYFSETLRLEMEMFNVPELIGAQAHAVNMILDAETAYPNLIFSDDLKSVRLGNKWERLPDGPERFDSCILALGSPSFTSGRHYWEVEVGDKTGWVLGACKASIGKKGNITLSPDKGYWVVIMMKENEYQASSVPPTRLVIKEPPKRVGIFVDCRVGNISFYNVTARSHIYTFSSCSFPGPVQPVFSPGTHDGGKNTGPLTICPVGGQGPE